MSMVYKKIKKVDIDGNIDFDQYMEDMKNTVPYSRYFEKIKGTVYEFYKIADEPWIVRETPLKEVPYVFLAHPQGDR